MSEMHRGVQRDRRIGCDRVLERHLRANQPILATYHGARVIVVVAEDVPRLDGVGKQVDEALQSRERLHRPAHVETVSNGLDELAMFDAQVMPLLPPGNTIA
jgi:hypothetical protein